MPKVEKMVSLILITSIWAPHKLKSADSTATVSFGKGEGKQFEISDAPVMLRRR